MKNINKLYLGFIATFLCSTVIITQAQQTITLTPSTMIPHEDGYYRNGVLIDSDDDGTPDEFHFQCEDYYEDEDFTDGYQPQLNYVESDTQQNFIYEKCMIMYDCLPKLGEDEEQIVHTGYIGIPPTEWAGKDTTAKSLAYIISPALSNVTYLTLETSSDVKITTDRNVPYNIDYSTDGGETWQDTYIQDYVANQGGQIVTYDDQHTDFGLHFEEMMNASKTQPIVFRIMTNDFFMNDRPNVGQVVKVHYIEIGYEEGNSNSEILNEKIKLSINNKTINSNEPIEVYSIMGQLIGTGTTINVPQNGIYLVKSTSRIEKVYIY